MPEPLFTWIHLSDIHIGHGDEEHRWDQKLVLERLKQDLPRVRELGAPPPDAIFVTGDVAFSGAARSPSEYADARAWLLSAGEAARVGPDRIFVVPGNHDVSRAGDRARQVARLLDELRSGAATTRASLDAALADAGDRGVLAGRMKAFLDFAADFAPWRGRAPLPPPEERLFWRAAIATPGGLTLRLVGLNTALLAADDADEGKLQLGKQQIHLALDPAPGPGELIVALSHHPLARWLSDGLEADRWLQSGAHLHLFGHVHEADLESARRGAGRHFIRVTAGAAHGERLPRGIPASHGYNVASVLRGEGGEALLRVWPRRWADRSRLFRADTDVLDDGQTFLDHVLGLKLPAAAPPPPSPREPPVGVSAAEPQSMQSNLQSMKSNLHPVQERPQSVQEHPQSVQEHPQSVQEHPQSMQEHPQSVQERPQSVQSHQHPAQTNPHPTTAVNPPATPATVSEGPVDVFLFYAPEDDELRARLEITLAPLRKSCALRIASRRSVLAGGATDDEVLAQVASSRLYLVLLSAWFAASDELDGPAMTQALARAARGEARLIPIYLRPFDQGGLLWMQHPMSKLLGLPRDKKPLVGAGRDLDSELAAIAGELRQVIDKLRAG